MAVRLICLLLSSLICGIAAAAAPPKWWIPSPSRFPPIPFVRSPPIPLFRPPPLLIPPLPFVPPVDDSPPWWNPPDSGDVPPGEDPPAPPSGGGGGGGGSCSCSCSFSSGPPPPPPTPKVIMVGGDSKWQYGFNYTDWINNDAGDIFVGDVLEFDYASKTNRKHTVYSMHNYLSFKTCNLSESIMLGNELAGSGPGGFRILLGMNPTGTDPFHYFACGEGKGDHCNNGMMKFAVKPIPRDNNPH